MAFSTALERLRNLLPFPNRGPEYVPIDAQAETRRITSRQLRRSSSGRPGVEAFSPYEYFTFLMLGIAMLWAWSWPPFRRCEGHAD